MVDERQEILDLFVCGKLVGAYRNFIVSQPELKARINVVVHCSKRRHAGTIRIPVFCDRARLGLYEQGIVQTHLVLVVVFCHSGVVHDRAIRIGRVEFAEHRVGTPAVQVVRIVCYFDPYESWGASLCALPGCVDAIFYFHHGAFVGRHEQWRDGRVVFVSVLANDSLCNGVCWGYVAI